MKPRSDPKELDDLPYGTFKYRITREQGSGALIVQRGCRTWAEGFMLGRPLQSATIPHRRFGRMGGRMGIPSTITIELSIMICDLIPCRMTCCPAGLITRSARWSPHPSRYSPDRCRERCAHLPSSPLPVPCRCRPYSPAPSG
jgi:hypothetical protein